MKRRLVVVTALLLVTALVAGCGGDDDEPDARPATEAPTEPNDADVEFAQQMIPHHEQAVEMAVLAPDRADSAEVKELAAAIQAAQDPEIRTMRGWLEEWGEPVEAEGGGHGSGMMGEDQMAQLEEASGVDFDRMFLEQMTEHHRSAIRMAETEIADGQFPDALELARTIRDTQQQEVDTMQGLLARIG